MEETFSIEMTKKDLENLLQLLDRVETRGLKEAMILVKIANTIETKLIEG